MVGDVVVPWLHGALSGEPGVKVIVSVDDDDGEVGEKDEEVGQEVADDQEDPGVDQVCLAGGEEVHRAGVQISLVHISAISQHHNFTSKVEKILSFFLKFSLLTTSFLNKS